MRQQNGAIWLAFGVAIASMVLCSTVWAEDLSVTVVTDVSATSMAEARFGLELDETWEVGGLAVWFAEDPGTDWGAGAYATLAVDPNGSVPVANWLPALGDWLDLPETVTAETYLIGKVICLPYDEGPQLAASIGAGAQIGPAVIEWVYDIVEGGDSDDPVLSSGATLWAGLRLEF